MIETIGNPDAAADQSTPREQFVAPAARPPREVSVDMRQVPMLKRLETILRAWKELEPGGAIRLTNDRAPTPLEVLFRTRERGKFDWSYEKQGPTEWIAIIRRKL